MVGFTLLIVPRIFKLCKLFARQHVFTAATDGYKRNIISQLDSNNSIFEAKSLSISDFDNDKHFFENGKEIDLLVGEGNKR